MNKTWPQKRLDDLFILQMGKTPARDNDKYWCNGKYKWVSIADIGKSQRYISDTKERITDLAVSESGIRQIPANTLIMSFKLSLGKVAITREPLYTNEAIMAFIDKGATPMSLSFLFHLFRNRDWSAGTNKAVMGKTLNKATLKNVLIPVPSLTEQERISRHLDAVLRLISLREAALQKLNQTASSRFIELFGDPRINPHGYDLRKLCKTCTVITGNTPSRAVPQYYGNFIEWIKTDNIIPGNVNPTHAMEFLSKEGMAIGRTAQAGAVLMACIAGSVDSIGKVCILDRKVAFNQQINAIIPSDYDVRFLYVMLQISKRYLIEDVSMALKGILSKSKLENKVFFVPPRALQNKFAAFIEELDKSKVTIQKSLDRLNLLYKALLQEYFG